MRKPKFILINALRIVSIILGVILALVYIGLPVGMGIVTILPARTESGGLPSGYQDVTIHTDDGVDLKAWYLPPENGVVIIILHGAGGSRANMLPYGEMLARHGYGALILDQRGHGESQGKTNRLGWQGTSDVTAAVTYLQGLSEVSQIGGLGSSMGAESLLGASSVNPAVEAIIADGASRRCLEEYLALESNRPLVHSFTVRLMYATVQVVSGEQPPIPVLEAIQKAPNTRFLFIAAGNGQQEVAFNQLFVYAVKDRASLWVVPGVDHTGAFSQYPEEYERRVVDFFQSVFFE